MLEFIRSKGLGDLQKKSFCFFITLPKNTIAAARGFLKTKPCESLTDTLLEERKRTANAKKNNLTRRRRSGSVRLFSFKLEQLS